MQTAGADNQTRHMARVRPFVKRRVLFDLDRLPDITSLPVKDVDALYPILPACNNRAPVRPFGEGLQVFALWQFNLGGDREVLRCLSVARAHKRHDNEADNGYEPNNHGDGQTDHQPAQKFEPRWLNRISWGGGRLRHVGQFTPSDDTGIGRNARSAP